MIKDPTELKNIRTAWETVRIFEAMVKTNLNAAFALGGVQTNEFRDLCNNLVLIFAFSVLEDTLRQLRREGLFIPAQRGFKWLMQDSQVVLSWVDFKTVDKGRERRNQIAHERKFLPRDECWKYIDAIENELVAWKILPNKILAEYTITVGRSS